MVTQSNGNPMKTHILKADILRRQSHSRKSVLVQSHWVMSVHEFFLHVCPACIALEIQLAHSGKKESPSNEVSVGSARAAFP